MIKISYIQSNQQLLMLPTKHPVLDQHCATPFPQLEVATIPIFKVLFPTMSFYQDPCRDTSWKVHINDQNITHNQALSIHFKNFFALRESDGPSIALDGKFSFQRLLECRDDHLY